MRIKLFENFNEAGHVTILKSFEEAESKLSGKNGIVINVTGDIINVEGEVNKIKPGAEAYVLITDQSGHIADSWKSDVFILDVEQEGAMTIADYFENNESTNEDMAPHGTSAAELRKVLWDKGYKNYFAAADKLRKTLNDNYNSMSVLPKTVDSDDLLKLSDALNKLADAVNTVEKNIIK